MDGQDELTILEVLCGFSDASLKGSRGILFELLVHKSAETLDQFDRDALESTFTVCVKQLKASTRQGMALIDLCLSLLCNLTITEENSKIFLDLFLNKVTSGLLSAKPEFAYAIDSFLSYDSQLVEVTEDEPIVPTQGVTEGVTAVVAVVAQAVAEVVAADTWEVKDPWQHMGSILCNLTRLEDGRKVLLKQSSQYMNKLVRQIRSRNPIRRRGAVASLRTCLFENEVHWWIIHEVGVLSFIMLPMVVATPFTELEKRGMDPLLWLNAENPLKKWEPEIDILMMLLECVILLCQKRGMREELRKKQVYPICRNLDYLQDDEGVSNLILEIVNLLMRDEDPDAPLEVENGPVHKASLLAIKEEEVANDDASNEPDSYSSIIEIKAVEESQSDENYLDIVD